MSSCRSLERLPYIPQKCHINFIVVCQIHRKLSGSQPTHRRRSASHGRAGAVAPGGAPALRLGLFQAAEWSVCHSSPSAALPCGEPCRRRRCCFRAQPVASEEIIFGQNSQLRLVQFPAFFFVCFSSLFLSRITHRVGATPEWTCVTANVTSCRTRVVANDTVDARDSLPSGQKHIDTQHAHKHMVLYHTWYRIAFLRLQTANFFNT